MSPLTLPSAPTAPIAVRCDDNRTTIRWLNQRHEHHPTTVVINPPAHQRLELREVAEAALDSMHHDSSLSTGKRSAEVLAASWIKARTITDAVFVDCQVHPLNRVNNAVEWFRGLGVRVWMCASVNEPTDLRWAAIENLAATHGGTTILYSSFRARFDDISKPARIAQLPVRVPLVDVLAFRPHCRDLLPPDTFEQVDRVFLETMQEMTAIVRRSTDRHRSRNFGRNMRQILLHATTTDDFVIKVRAIQAVGLREGFIVNVLTPLMLGREAVDPRPGKLDADGGWRTLQRYRDPDVGALAALTLHGLLPEEIVRLTIESTSIDADGTVQIRTGERSFGISGDPAVAVRALIHSRQLTSEDPREALFRTHRDEKLHTSRIYKTLAPVGAETGHEVTAQQLGRQRIDWELWLGHYGITVRVIGRHDARHLNKKRHGTCDNTD